MALDSLPEDALSPSTFLPVSTSRDRALAMLPLPGHAESAGSRFSLGFLPCSPGAEPALHEGARNVRECLARHERPLQQREGRQL